jgi:hypothetical protein
MPTKDDFVRYVTDFLAAPKSLAGIDVPVQWAPGRQSGELTTKIPIERDGAQEGEMLVIVYIPSRSGFAINIVCSQLCVTRLDFDSHGPHVNGFGGLNDGMPLEVGERHFHKWESNMRFVEALNAPLDLKYAEDCAQTLRNFDDVLRHFCDDNNIQLPNGHYIELPRVLL